MEPDNPLLDDYVLQATGKTEPRVCFIGTASGDADEYIVRFYKAFRDKARPSHLSLVRPHTAEIREFVLSQDAVYVGGCNTKSLMALWREWGLVDILREAWEKGVVLSGISAGCICWFEQGVTDSIPGRMSVLSCCGYVRGSACPHYNGEADRRPSYQRLVARGEIAPGYALDDCAALHFVASQEPVAVSSVRGARAYRVRPEGTGFIEEPLETRFLG